eukprot:12282994-Alexandrium_andersonii.AAC.1
MWRGPPQYHPARFRGREVSAPARGRALPRRDPAIAPRLRGLGAVSTVSCELPAARPVGRMAPRPAAAPRFARSGRVACPQAMGSPRHRPAG